MNLSACALLLAPLLVSDGGPRVDTRMVWPGPTPEAEWLLRIAEDKGRPYKDRVKAVEQLGQRREKATVPRLLRMVPGDYDVVTLRAVIALRQIGDRRALPALQKVNNDPSVELPGKIRTHLQGTIDEWSKPAR